VTGRPDLADRIALAIVEHGPLPGSTLATLVAVRKATVLDELHTNPRFVQLGRRCGSRWRLAAGNHYDPGREPLGPNLGDGSTYDMAERLDALERRVVELECHLADREARTS
jgi:hypothetical protein